MKNCFWVAGLQLCIVSLISMAELPDYELVDLGDYGYTAYASAINDVGQYVINVYASEPNQNLSYLYSEEEITSLPGDKTRSHSINNDGTVVGQSEINGRAYAFFIATTN